MFVQEWSIYSWLHSIVAANYFQKQTRNKQHYLKRFFWKVCKYTKELLYLWIAIFASCFDIRDSPLFFCSESSLNFCCNVLYSCESVSIVILSFSCLSESFNCFLSFRSMIFRLSISDVPLSFCFHFCIMMFKVLLAPNKTTLRCEVHLAMHSTRKCCKL